MKNPIGIRHELFMKPWTFHWFCHVFFNNLHNHIHLYLWILLGGYEALSLALKLSNHFLWLGCKMADGNWYRVGATRVLGCTHCTCEARDYVYCVDLCPGKYTNTTKEKLQKSVNYQVWHSPPPHTTLIMFDIK